MSWLNAVAQWLVYVIAIAAAAAGLAIGMGILNPDVSPSFLFLLFGWFPVVVVHELGHALAATLTGWRVWIFHAAPFALRPRPFSVTLVGNMGGPDTGGFVLSLPRTAAVDTWQRKAWIIAGGPIASWLMVAACFAYACRPVAEPALGEYVAAALGFYSLSVAALTSWPLRERNDAASFLALLRKRKTTGAPHTGIWLARELWAFGIPQRAIEPWMREACEKATAQGQPEFALFTHLLDALVLNDEANVRARTKALAAQSPESPEAQIAQGFVAAWYDGDITRADDHFARRSKLLDEDVHCLRQLGLLTIFRVNGEIEAAEKAADEGRYLAWQRWKFHGSPMDNLLKKAMTRRLPHPRTDRPLQRAT